VEHYLAGYLDVHGGVAVTIRTLTGVERSAGSGSIPSWGRLQGSVLGQCAFRTSETTSGSPREPWTNSSGRSGSCLTSSSCAIWRSGSRGRRVQHVGREGLHVERLLGNKPFGHDAFDVLMGRLREETSRGNHHIKSAGSVAKLRCSKYAGPGELRELGCRRFRWRHDEITAGGPESASTRTASPGYWNHDRCRCRRRRSPEPSGLQPRSARSAMIASVRGAGSTGILRRSAARPVKSLPRSGRGGTSRATGQAGSGMFTSHPLRTSSMRSDREALDCQLALAVGQATEFGILRDAYLCFAACVQCGRGGAMRRHRTCTAARVRRRRRDHPRRAAGIPAGGTCPRSRG
jgi:hypothetical protein